MHRKNQSSRRSEDGSHNIDNITLQLPVTYLSIRRFIETILIVVFSPLIFSVCFVVGLAVYLDSGRPVIFKQKRPGVNEREFTIYKFRTMNIPDKKITDYRHEQNRVTRVGNFIRRYRLDELPQFVNILKGDMSLIGPRPEPDFYYNACVKEIPGYYFRKIVKPGLTGWHQVMGGHTDDIEGAAEKLEYDIEYLRNISLRLDMKILWKTIGVIINKNGAK